MTNERAQYEADQLHISELEAANERLQAKINEFAGMLLDYETKFDLIAEKEAKRMIEFGEKVRRELAPNSNESCFQCSMNVEYYESIDIQQLYTNFKKP